MDKLSETVHCITLPGDPWLSADACPYREDLAVFRLGLDNNAPLVAHLPELLQPDERDQAGRFRQPGDRRRFTLARGLLRLIAGAYLNRSPAEIRFAAGPNRKPELVDAPGWHFNVSHSGDWILLAFGRVPVGVDVEYVDPRFATADLLPVSFSPEERAYVAAQVDVHRAFYHLWTRKEALAKATGRGIDDNFAHLPALDGTHHLASQVLGQDGRWAVWSVTVASAYPAAVAYRLPDAPDPTVTPRFYTVDGGSLLARAGLN